jgi:hypothetical protein
MMSRSLGVIQQVFFGRRSAAVDQVNSDSADSVEFHGFDIGQWKLVMRLAPAACGHALLSVRHAAA